MIASLCFFDPVLAEWALFEFLTFAKFEECFIKLLRVLSQLVFGAALISVEEGTAIQAVVILANRASKFKSLALARIAIVNEGVVAVGSGAPRQIFLGVDR